MHNFMILCAAAMLGAAVPKHPLAAGITPDTTGVIMADTTGSIAAAGIITEVGIIMAAGMADIGTVAAGTAGGMAELAAGAIGFQDPIAGTG